MGVRATSRPRSWQRTRAGRRGPGGDEPRRGFTDDRCGDVVSETMSERRECAPYRCSPTRGPDGRAVISAAVWRCSTASPRFARERAMGRSDAAARAFALSFEVVRRDRRAARADVSRFAAVTSRARPACCSVRRSRARATSIAGSRSSRRLPRTQTRPACTRAVRAEIAHARALAHWTRRELDEAERLARAGRGRRRRHHLRARDAAARLRRDGAASVPRRAGALQR